MNKKISVWFTVGFLVLLFTLIAVIVTGAYIKFKDHQQRNELLSHVPSVKVNDDKPTVVVFGDYKCPYCKMYEQGVYPMIEREYIKKKKVNYYFVNAQLLGKDSKHASVIGHAIFKYKPSKYWKFHKNMFDRQPNHEGDWITNKVIYEEINKLSLPNETKNKIVDEYKDRNSESWKLARNDEKLLDLYKVKQVPTVYINNKKIDDPYSKTEIKKQINKEL